LPRRVLALFLLLPFAFLLTIARREARTLRASADEVDAHVLLPPPAALRILSLGYTELAADLAWVRTVVYYGDGMMKKHGAPDLGQLLTAVTLLDPNFRRPYLWGAHALTFRNQIATQEEYRLSADLLRRAVEHFPRDWELSWLLGLRLFLDVKVDDPAEQRRLREEGATYMERAMRMPHAPQTLAGMAAAMRTKLGQRERALRELREMIYATTDASARETLLQRYTNLSSSADAAAEIRAQAERFEAEWKAELPYVPPTLYLMVGPRPAPGFALRDYAADDRTVQTE
jgi:hypothetical protein